MPDEPPVVGLASEVVAEPEKSPLIPLTIVWQADERPWGPFSGWFTTSFARNISPSYESTGDWATGGRDER
jgi:hypothetical protein